MDRVAIPRKDQRVGDRVAFLLEERHSTPDDGSIRFVNLLGGIEHRRQDVQSAGGLEGREMNDALVWRAGAGPGGDIDAQLTKLIERA